MKHIIESNGEEKVIHMRQSTCNIFILDMQGKLFQNLLIQSKQLYTENKTSNILLQQLTTQHPEQTGMRQCIFMQH